MNLYSKCQPRLPKWVLPRLTSMLVAVAMVPTTIVCLCANSGVQYTVPSYAASMEMIQEQQTRPVKEEAAAEPVPTPHWSAEDASLLAAVIAAESRGEPYEGQLAVGCVVLNRLESGWADSIHDVVYAPHQFASPYWDYGEISYQAAVECLNGKRTLPASVVFFQVSKVDEWYDADWYCTIGHHNFYIRKGV